MATYDPRILGGKVEEVADILRENVLWNPDVVKELIRWGAHPPLFDAQGCVHGKHFTTVNCTFRAPNGTLVRNVYLPIGLVKLEYPEQTRHLVI